MSAGPDVVVIPAGDALLEDPPRTLHVEVFAIARRLVTTAEFDEFAAASGQTAARRSGSASDHPAEGLAWTDAVVYCRTGADANGGASLARRLRASEDLRGHSFRVVRSMTGR